MLSHRCAKLCNERKTITKWNEMMLNAQWLDTFFVLCEAGHFTKAAGRLNMPAGGIAMALSRCRI